MKIFSSKFKYDLINTLTFFLILKRKNSNMFNRTFSMNYIHQNLKEYK